MRNKTTKFKIEIAGTVAEVDALFESSKRICKDYITDKPAELSITITEDDIEKERYHSTIDTPSVQNLEYMALYRKLCTELASRDTVLVHGSCVSVDGQAYLFCAPSGTGKSTHTRLWRNALGGRAIMINDDKPLLRINDNYPMIYGSPWNGKHKLGNNVSATLKAICFLERGEINSIEKISSEDALSLLLKYTFRPSDTVKTIAVLDTVTKLTELCNFWSLKCNMDQEAAQVSYIAMSTQ